jgi:hypothetical protein
MLAGFGRPLYLIRSPCITPAQSPCAALFIWSCGTISGWATGPRHPQKRSPIGRASCFANFVRN